jgi:hypothetical protein
MSISSTWSPSRARRSGIGPAWVFMHENNRDGDKFECLNCGKQLHSDYRDSRRKPTTSVVG